MLVFACLLCYTLDLEKHRFELHKPTYVCFCNKHIDGPLYPLVSHPQFQATSGGKQYQLYAVGNPKMVKANSMQFYIRDLSICRF